jgi:hypothetical protein
MDGLSKAVLHWLEYQHYVGVDRFLNESALTIPIVAYLSTKGWEINKETDYGKLCQSVTPDKCYADFYFTQGKSHLVLETKLYKASAQSKLFNDVVRLALPVDGNLQRCLLVVYPTQRKMSGQFDLLLNLPEKEKVELDTSSARLKGRGQELPLGHNEDDFAKLRAFTTTTWPTIGVTCVGRSRANNYSVVVLSVERRSESSPAFCLRSPPSAATSTT